MYLLIAIFLHHSQAVLFKLNYRDRGGNLRSGFMKFTSETSRKYFEMTDHVVLDCSLRKKFPASKIVPCQF